jgi:hypothetical protein
MNSSLFFRIARGSVRRHFLIPNVLAGNRTLKKVKFALQQAMKAQRGSRGIALFFL